MKMCDRHWSDLKKRIGERGLTHFCARTTNQASDRIRDTRMFTEDNFEPLMGAYYRIAANAVTVGDVRPDEECCPLCRLNAANGAQNSNDWINNAVHEQVRIAEKMNLIPRGR